MIGLAVATVLAAAALVGSERAVEARIERLQSSGRLPHVPFERDPAAPRIVETFARLSRELEVALGSWAGRPGGELPSCVPAYWSEEHGCELELQVAQAAHVLEELDELLESDDVRSVLERDGVVVNVLDRGYAGSMGNLRHWVNALGARAVVRARAWDAKGAAESLVRAAELQELVNDRTGRGLAFRSMVTAIVMMAAERVIEISPYAAPTLRQELEPILNRFASPEAAHEAYSADVAWFLRQTNGYRGAWDVSPAYRVELLRTADGMLDLMDEPFPQELYFQRPVPYPPSAELTWALLHRLSLNQRRRAAVCRMGLALLAHREVSGAWPASLDELRPDFGGSVPTDPVTGALFRYEVEADVVLLAPDDVIQEGFHETAPTWARGAFLWRSSLERDG